MNRFFRAIGFGNVKNESEIRPVINAVLLNPEEEKKLCEEPEMLYFVSGGFGENFGIGIFANLISSELHEKFSFPYAFGNIISTREEITLEKRFEENGFLGMSNMPLGGINMIFFVNNPAECEQGLKEKRKMEGVCISGLCTEGMILLPLKKSAKERQLVAEIMGKKAGLLEAASGGDENAVQSLTTEELCMMREISTHLDFEDVYTIIDTYFMPSGMESDRYSLIGEIQAVNTLENTLTGEQVYRLDLLSNDMRLQVFINTKDLEGEPAVGRRFKGEVWLQGKVLFS